MNKEHIIDALKKVTVDDLKEIAIVLEAELIIRGANTAVPGKGRPIMKVIWCKN